MQSGMRECHSTLPVIAHDGKLSAVTGGHIPGYVNAPLPAACMVLCFSMLELKVCFCTAHRSCATEMPT